MAPVNYFPFFLLLVIVFFAHRIPLFLPEARLFSKVSPALRLFSLSSDSACNYGFFPRSPINLLVISAFDRASAVFSPQEAAYSFPPVEERFFLLPFLKRYECKA